MRCLTLARMAPRSSQQGLGAWASKALTAKPTEMKESPPLASLPIAP